MSGGNTITIWVSRIGDTTDLSLKQDNSKPGSPGDPGGDNIITTVSAKQTIYWKVNKTPDAGRNNDITLLHVKAADASLPKNANSQQLLVEDLYEANDEGVIEGVVLTSPPASSQPGQKAFENYQIGFYLNSDPSKTEIWDDPKLIMK